MSESTVFNFATIGEVFEDGVSLIFDGQEEASEKHYKVNTSILFTAGDRVKILADSGTYVVEYVVGAPNPVYGIPKGGEEGQVLQKQSAEDYKAVWAKQTGLPSGGSAGQILKKSSEEDYDAAWGSVKGILPTGGTTGQVLKKSGSSDFDAIWGAVDGTLPTGGTTDQVLTKSSATNYAAAWKDAPTPTMANGVVNQYRTSESFRIQFQTDYSGNFYIRSGTSGTWKQITTA